MTIEERYARHREKLYRGVWAGGTESVFVGWGWFYRPFFMLARPAGEAQHQAAQLDLACLVASS